MGETFRVKVLWRNTDTDRTSWGKWRYFPNTTAERAIDDAKGRNCGKQWQPAGVVCELEQPGGVYASN